MAIASATTVQIQNGALAIDAYLALPTGTGPFPGIVVLQEVFGVNSHIRSIVARLAEAGYVAIAPALYQRTAPGFEVSYSPEDLQQGRHYKDQTTAPELLSDIQAAIAYLQGLPQVESSAIGCIGFCFGGHVAYLAATLPSIKATASFYGAGIATFTPGGGAPTLSRTSEIQGAIDLFFGLQDPLIPLEQISAIEQELQAQKIDYHIWRYDTAGHGFCCDQRADYHPTAAADAWEHVFELFDRKLQKGDR